MKFELVPEVADILRSPVEAVQWVGQQEPRSQASHAGQLFETLMEQAAQPRSVSGNSRVKLCGFVDQASKAPSQELRAWALSRDILLRLFNFYVEWDESDHQRSMKLVLDLVTQLLRRNPNSEAVTSATRTLLDTLVSIVAGSSTKPVIKSAMKTLEHFLAKKIFTLDDLKPSYTTLGRATDQLEDIQIWKSLFADIFRWMQMPYICPIAGKLIACLLRLLRQREKDVPCGFTHEAWHQWLLDFLAEDPNLLEGIKHYIFLPTFKADKAEALPFLLLMNEKPVAPPGDLDLDLPTFLQLAALETGKKVGLVEDPDIGDQEAIDKQNSSIVLHENVIEGVLAHPSSEVRTLALSLLVTSPSTTKPFSPTALGLLRKNLAIVFADADAKFRVDVSGKVRDMFRRVRGAICVLKRSIPRARAKARKDNQFRAEGDLAATAQPVVYRTNLVALPEPQLAYCLGYHEEFLRWYIQFLRGELAPTASYQRHVASVKALTFILRMEADTTKQWETAEDPDLFFDLFDDKWVRALFDLVVDRFDDVRELSAGAIKTLFSDIRYRRFTMGVERGDNSPAEDLSELLRRATELAQRTARADHSDGVARACQLVYRFSQDGESRLALLRGMTEELDRKLRVAGEDLGRAVLEAPVHSDFAALCLTWRVVSEVSFSESELIAVEALQNNLVTSCERMWSAVKDILCDDSPEGHLPQELEEVDGLDTKDVLSYSFRAIHESSNLMRTMALTAKNRSRDNSIATRANVFARIGNLTFDQLSSLRHRGAFTTVSLTFATCCQQTKHLDDQALLDSWYDGTMKAIFTQASTTRRSAGIPSLMTGILSANASHPSFSQAMERLIEIAGTEARVTETDGTNLPQVHAFNCMKDIYRNSLLASLGNQSETYLPRCLELAASGLRSEVWAIRNCGLIFLRSLIDCLFGTGETKAMIEAGWDGQANRIQYHRYPSLPKVLVSLIKTGRQMITETASSSSAAESVFPALDIVRRAGPPEVLRGELQAHVVAYLASPVWHVREIAARTLCSCLLHDKWLAAIREIFRDALADRGKNIQNHVHGALLTLKFVFGRLSEVALDQLLADMPPMADFLAHCGINTRFSHCPDIVAAYLEVVNLIWRFRRSRSQTLYPFDVSVPANMGTALLRLQKITTNVLSASQERDPVAKLHNLLLGNHVGVNSLVTALETIPTVWPNMSTSNSTLSDLFTLYVDVCLQTGIGQAQAVAVQNLAEIMDKLLLSGELDKIPSSSLWALWAALTQRPMSPSLSNAVTRASGCIVAALCHSHEVSAAGLQSWGLMMANAGLYDQSLDARLAAAGSLRSFFCAADTASCVSEEHLPVFLALYDALNDDDDDVRAVASAAARPLLGQPLVPPEAATALLAWLSRHLAHAPSLRPVVAARIAGVPAQAGAAWPPAHDLLAAALRVDDSLFAVEEKNLFIDPAREAARWTALLRALPWDQQEESLARLDAWVCDGLAEVRRLVGKRPDGPLGWASMPRVFALCSRVFRAAVALERGPGSVAVRESVKETRAMLSSQGGRVSGLLVEQLNDG